MNRFGLTIAVPRGALLRETLDALDVHRRRHRRGARERPPAALRATSASSRCARATCPPTSRRAPPTSGSRARTCSWSSPSARSSSCSTSATAAARWCSRASTTSPTRPPRRCAASASCGWRRSTRGPAARFFERTGRQAEIVEVKGSVELAPLTGLVEAIVDLTATGTTLRENRLVVREEIAVSTARLIANPVAHKLKAAAIDEVVEGLRGR